MAGKRRGDSGRGEGLSWAVIIVMFAIGLWPVGLLLLFLKLWNGGGGQDKENASPGDLLFLPHIQVLPHRGKGRPEAAP